MAITLLKVNLQLLGVTASFYFLHSACHNSVFMCLPIACLPPQNAGESVWVTTICPLSSVLCLLMAALGFFQKGLLWSLTFRYSPCPWHLSTAVGLIIFCQHSGVIPPDSLGSLACSLSASLLLSHSLSGLDLWFHASLFLASLTPSPWLQPQWHARMKVTRKKSSLLGPEAHKPVSVCCHQCLPRWQRDCPLRALMSEPCGVLVNA